MYICADGHGCVSDLMCTAPRPHCEHLGLRCSGQQPEPSRRRRSMSTKSARVQATSLPQPMSANLHAERPRRRRANHPQFFTGFVVVCERALGSKVATGEEAIRAGLSGRAGLTTRRSSLSLIRAKTSLKARFNSLLDRNNFPVRVGREFNLTR